MYPRLLIVLFLALPALALAADGQRQAPGNILHFPQPDQAPEEVYAVIEIPTGSITKYELDADTGFLIADRFQSMPVAYPANYGTFPSTLAGDNDPLDVIVYTREPVVPGALIRVRPIGVLRMLDAGAQDDKIIAVPVSKVDPSYDNIRDIADLPALELDRLQAFFRVYKQLPEGRKSVELQEMGGPQMARELIVEAIGRAEGKE